MPAGLRDAAFEPNFSATVGHDAAARLLRAPRAKHSLLAYVQALALQVCSDGKLLLQLPSAIGTLLWLLSRGALLYRQEQSGSRAAYAQAPSGR